MDYFFYNTDSTAIIDKPRPRFGVLIDRKLAAVGGDRKKFGEQLGKLSPDDILMMYENLIGIIAIGKVMERWDEVTHNDSFIPVIVRVLYSAHNATGRYEGVGALQLKPEAGARPVQRHLEDIKQLVKTFIES